MRFAQLTMIQKVMQKVLNPKLSVIVTVYNTEKYITDCLQSVISQSQQNFEIIIVDGGYPDKSMDVCREFAEKYDNITMAFQIAQILI